MALLHQGPQLTYHHAPSVSLPDLQGHLLRLGPQSRYHRFCHPIGDAAIAAYCRKCRQEHGFVLYATSYDILRAVVEIHLLPGQQPVQAELALSVEDRWQNAGIGSDLVFLALLEARETGISRVGMVCLAENIRMRQVAKKYQAVFSRQAAEIRAVFEPQDLIDQDLGTEGRHLPVPLHS